MVRLGYKGEAVKDIQKKLAKAGYDITADGFFGRETQRIIREFQQMTGIHTDGLFGAKTKALLDACLLRMEKNEPRTEHFSMAMFISKDDQSAVKYGIPGVYWDNLLGLMERLEKIEEAVQKPLIIRSGYRSPEYNKKVGGTAFSQHLLAKAADIYVKDYALSCYALAKQIYETPALKAFFGGMGLGSEKNVHVDIREKVNPKSLTIWWYTSKSWKSWSRV